MSMSVVSSAVRKTTVRFVRQNLPLVGQQSKQFSSSRKWFQEHHSRPDTANVDDHDYEYNTDERDTYKTRPSRLESHDDRFDVNVNRRRDRYSGRFSEGERNDPYASNNSQFGGLDFDELEEKDWSNVQDFESNVYNPKTSMSAEQAQEFRRQHDITIVYNEDVCPSPVSDFEDANFQDGITEFFKSSGFQEPMPIQAQGWPIAMSGRDLIAIGQTGSGKTLGFLVPAIEHIIQAKMSGSNSGYNPKALIVAPTRELAQQTEAVFKKVQRKLGQPRLQSACLFGGASRGVQLKNIRYGVDIVIATPGRLLDFLQTRELSLEDTTYLVLDEADRMLDMGFEPQIRKILSQIRPDRQMSMWSATWPREVQSLAKNLLSTAENSKRGQHVHLNIGSADLQANKDITQQLVFVDRDYDKQAKLEELLDQIAGESGSKVLVFCKTKRSADYIEQHLRRQRHRAIAIHGDKSQNARDNALHSFRSGRSQILVATDVAARGLDVDDISHVVNYDLPNDVEDYIHRIGRTGRRGRKGTSVSLLTMYADDTIRLARPLIKVMKQAGQEVPQELEEMADQHRGGSHRRPQRRNSFNDRFGDRPRGGGYGGYGRESYNREFQSRDRYSNRRNSLRDMDD